MPQEVQRPVGPEDRVCPFHRRAMSEVCHRCPLWVHVLGKHPQSDGPVDMWDCAFAWGPMLMIENSQMQRQTGAAVETFRNEMVRANEISHRIASAAPRLINGDQP